MLVAKKQRIKYEGLQYKSMIKIEVGSREYELEDKDAALVESIKDLTRAIRRMNN